MARSAHRTQLDFRGLRVALPEEQWIRRHDESLRIFTEEQWEKVQARFRNQQRS